MFFAVAQCACDLVLVHPRSVVCVRVCVLPASAVFLSVLCPLQVHFNTSIYFPFFSGLIFLYRTLRYLVSEWCAIVGILLRRLVYSRLGKAFEGRGAMAASRKTDPQRGFRTFTEKKL